MTQSPCIIYGNLSSRQKYCTLVPGLTASDKVLDSATFPRAWLRRAGVRDGLARSEEVAPQEFREDRVRGPTGEKFG